MKLVLGTTLVLLLAGAPMYAGQEPDKDKPKEEPKKEEPKKNEAPRRNEAPARQDERKPEERKQEPANNNRPAQQNDRTQQQQQERTRTEDRNRTEQHPAQQQDRAQDQHRAQQTEQHRDNDRDAVGGHGRRVPEDKFRASFGTSHHFHVQRNDDRRFNYGGYYFTYQEPWPSDWDYNDDVYIDEIDGEYYLIDPRHPGVRLLVVIAD